ncbi:MAG: PorV/PorQ family protein, partial [Elusimicrobia bacterium]|nr:PorV/PorQ family protein [Elusimicrobiota bacterium]
PSPLTPLVSAGEPGSASMDFLRLGVGVRQMGMGGTGIALGDDVHAAYFNPAGLSQLGRQELALSHAEWLDQIRYQTLYWAYPRFQYGTFAAQFQYLSYGTIPGYDNSGKKTADVQASDVLGGISWGGKIHPDLSVGAAFQYLRENLETSSGQTWAGDVGLLYRPVDVASPWLSHLSWGLVARHIGPGPRFISERERLPTSVGAGAAFKAMGEALTLSLDLEKPVDSALSILGGSEYWIKDVFALRAGFRAPSDLGSGLSLGLGVKVGQVQLDYALASMGDFGYTHRVGLIFRFGGVVEQIYHSGIHFMRVGRYAEAVLEFDKVLSLNPEHRQALLRLKECQVQMERQGEKK